MPFTADVKVRILFIPRERIQMARRTRAEEVLLYIKLNIFFSKQLLKCRNRTEMWGRRKAREPSQAVIIIFNF